MPLLLCRKATIESHEYAYTPKGKSQISTDSDLVSSYLKRLYSLARLANTTSPISPPHPYPIDPPSICGPTFLGTQVPFTQTLSEKSGYDCSVEVRVAFCDLFSRLGT